MTRRTPSGPQAAVARAWRRSAQAVELKARCPSRAEACECVTVCADETRAPGIAPACDATHQVAGRTYANRCVKDRGHAGAHWDHFDGGVSWEGEP